MPKRERRARRGQGSDCVTNLRKQLIIFTTDVATPVHHRGMIGSNTSGRLQKTPSLSGRLGGTLGGLGTMVKEKVLSIVLLVRDYVFNIKVILNKIS